MGGQTRQREEAAWRRALKRWIVPELRYGLRMQWASLAPPKPATRNQLNHPLHTGDERTLPDGPVRVLNQFYDVLDRHAPERIATILEWGTGHSTSYLYDLAAARDADLFLTIDHSERYQSAFVKRFPAAEFFQARSEDLTGYTTQDPREDGYNYATIPLTYDREFDLISIDGRRRNECLLVAHRILARGGIVILHDAYRPRYDVGCALFETVADYPDCGHHRVMRRKA